MEQAKAKAQAKAQVKENPNVSPTITTKVVTKSGINHTAEFEINNFAKSIGGLLQTIPESFELSLFGSKIKVSGVTPNTDQKERVLTFLKGLNKGIFEGLEIDQQVKGSDVQTTQKLAILTSLQDAGIICKGLPFTRRSVVDSVNVWIKNKRARKSAISQEVIAKNLHVISETNVLMKYAKDLREENKKALTILEANTRAKLGLPAPAVADKKGK